MSASLNFDGKVAWVNERFARCEMMMEKCQRRTSLVKLGCSQVCDDLFDIDWSSLDTSAGVTGVKSESIHFCVADQDQR